MQATIYLIRHGKTQANLEDRFAGQGQNPLCPAGHQQMIELVNNIPPDLDTIYSGPLLRTVESAEIIARQLAIPFKIRSELIDISLPHWDGLTKDEIRSKFGDEYPTWLTSPDKFAVSGCETIAAVQSRAVKSLAAIIAENPSKKILLVTHLIVARALILHCTKQPISKFREIKVDNGQIVNLTDLQTAKL